MGVHIPYTKSTKLLTFVLKTSKKDTCVMKQPSQNLITKNSKIQIICRNSQNNPLYLFFFLNNNQIIHSYIPGFSGITTNLVFQL